MAIRKIVVLAAALAGLSGWGASRTADAGEPGKIPPGIYAMYRGSDPAAEDIASTVARQCWAMPLVVYDDGLWIGHQLNPLAEIKKSGAYYRTLGTSTVASQKGTTIEVRAENGVPGSGGHVETRTYQVVPAKFQSVVLVSPDGKDDRVLRSCMASRFDIPGEDGRNYFEELTKRPDGRPAGIPTPWRG